MSSIVLNLKRESWASVLLKASAMYTIGVIVPAVYFYLLLFTPVRFIGGMAAAVVLFFTGAFLTNVVLLISREHESRWKGIAIISLASQGVVLAIVAGFFILLVIALNS